MISKIGYTKTLSYTMMTRSQTRIAQLEEEKDFYKDLHEGFAYKLFLKEKELQARIVELEKRQRELTTVEVDDCRGG